MLLHSLLLLLACCCRFSIQSSPNCREGQIYSSGGNFLAKMSLSIHQNKSPPPTDFGVYFKYYSDRLLGLARTWQNTIKESLSNNNAHRQTSMCHKTQNARLLLIMRHQFADSDTTVHSALSIRSLRRDSLVETCELTDWLPRTMHFKIDGQK